VIPENVNAPKYFPQFKNIHGNPAQLPRFSLALLQIGLEKH